MKKFCIIIGLLLMCTSVKAEVIEIGNKALASLIEKQVPIIDIRRQEEWAQTGIIEGSILMTFFDMKAFICRKKKPLRACCPGVAYL